MLTEMDEAGDIVRISVFFVTGVGLSAWPAWSDILPPEYPAAISLTLSALLLADCCHRSNCSISLSLLFLALGLFCGFNCHLSPLHGLRLPAAMDSVSAVIRDTGYGKERTVRLVEALLTGRKGGLDPAIRESFRASGASHLLALSGLHLGVIYLLLARALTFMGRSRAGSLARSLIIITFCCVYAFLTGASPSIVRALIFIMLNEVSKLKSERHRKPLRTFCAAATVQLAFNPSIISSVSFQLSYLAMLGIIVLFPKLDCWYPASGRYDPVRKVWTSMAMSISCQMTTAPLVWLRFGTFPRHFLLTNLLAMPLSESIIILSASATLLHVLGINADLLARLTDKLSDALVKSMDIISSM